MSGLAWCCEAGWPLWIEGENERESSGFESPTRRQFLSKIAVDFSGQICDIRSMGYEIAYEDDTHEVIISGTYLYIRLKQFDIVKCDEDCGNELKLSAYLACELGYKKAYDILFENNVDKSSMLWDLNHSNPWR